MILNQSIKKKMNKQINIRKSISFLMSMLMFLGMIPFSTGIAYAEGRNGITSLDKLEAKEYIYMGVQGSGLQGAEKEIKWRVLDKNANNGNPDGLFLLSEELLGSGSNGGVEYYKSFSFSRIEWKKSDANKWCKEFSGETQGEKTSLDDRELDAILSTNKSDEDYTSKGTTVAFPKADHILNGDKVFFLSAEEADKTYFTSMDERKAKYNGEVKEWWLRSYSSSNPSIVNENGEVKESSVSFPKAARPAFNLEKSKVMYISPAEDGKQSGVVGEFALTTVGTTDTKEWKLTLKDDTRSSFEVKSHWETGMEVTIKYAGAKTGTNEYLSAVVTDESNTEIKYYGRIKHLKEDSDKEGIAKVDLNGKFEDGDKLFVFNEQYNGDKKTDYSSDRKKIEGINIKKFYNVLLEVSPKNVGVLSKYGVSHVAEDTAISAIDNELTVGTEKVTATANTGYRFKEWAGIPKNGKVTGNVAVTAVFEKKISGGKHSSDKDKDKRRYPIEKGKMNHGTITVESEGRYGEEITVTAEPDRGYEVDKIKVTDDSGKDIEVTEKKGDKYTFSMPRRKVTVEATFKKIERPSNNNG